MINVQDLGVGILIHNSKKYMDYLDKLGDVSQVYELLLIHYMKEPKEIRKVAELLDKPIIAHTTRYSFGTDSPTDNIVLSKIKELIELSSAKWVGDHLCFTGIPSMDAGTLLPPFYIEESLNIFSNKIKDAKKTLNVPIAIENVVQSFNEIGNYSQATFLGEVVKRTDSRIVLSLENISSSKAFYPLDYYEFINELPTDRIIQIHCPLGNELEQKKMESRYFGTVYDKQLFHFKLLEYLAKNKKVRPKSVIWELETETNSLPEVEELRERISWAKKLFYGRGV